MVQAHKIYTIKVFSLFVQLKEESEFYRCTAVVAGQQYVAEHYDLNRVQRWCRGKYIVDVLEGGLKYCCECGLFGHFGLPCSHILRVKKQCACSAFVYFKPEANNDRLG